MILDELDAETRALLDRYGFDAVVFDELCARVASGELSQAANVVRGVVEPPDEKTLLRLPEPGTSEWSDRRETGVAAIRAGRVAQAVLAGSAFYAFDALASLR